MVTIKFGTITNKTDSKLVISRFLFLNEMPAKEEEFSQVAAHQTVTINKKIDLQMVDHNVYSAPLLVKKETDPNVHLLLSVAWGQALFVDMQIQNLNTQQTIDIETIMKRHGVCQNCTATVDLVIEGNLLEKSRTMVYEITQ